MASSRQARRIGVMRVMGYLGLSRQSSKRRAFQAGPVWLQMADSVTAPMSPPCTAVKVRLLVQGALRGPPCLLLTAPQATSSTIAPAIPMGSEPKLVKKFSIAYCFLNR